MTNERGAPWVETSSITQTEPRNFATTLLEGKVAIIVGASQGYRRGDGEDIR
jgi:hypothetical protein